MAKPPPPQGDPPKEPDDCPCGDGTRPGHPMTFCNSGGNYRPIPAPVTVPPTGEVPGHADFEQLSEQEAEAAGYRVVDSWTCPGCGEYSGHRSGCPCDVERPASPRAEAAPGLRPAHVVAAEAVTAGWLTRAGYYTKRAALESAFTKAIEADRASRPAPVTVPGAREVAHRAMRGRCGVNWIGNGFGYREVHCDECNAVTAAIEAHARGLAAEVERLTRENEELRARLESLK